MPRSPDRAGEVQVMRRRSHLLPAAVTPPLLCSRAKVGFGTIVLAMGEISVRPL